MRLEHRTLADRETEIVSEEDFLARGCRESREMLGNLCCQRTYARGTTVAVPKCTARTAPDRGARSTMRRFAAATFVLALLVAHVRPAHAVPLLQLDLRGGVYDPVTETIVADGGEFELFALLTPKANATAADIQALLADTYYISVALTPPVGPTDVNLGSIEFGGTSVAVTGDMTYGTPPLEAFMVLQGHDSGDLAKHGIFPTFFWEFAFTFDPTARSLVYNTQDNPGGPTPDAGGRAFYASFLGDSSLLSSGYNLHFDLYDTKVRNCGKSGFPSCVDIDVNHFAPFSHDAETRERVPEPSSTVLLMLGLSAVGMGTRRFSIG